jgi:hypothetical protein
MCASDICRMLAGIFGDIEFPASTAVFAESLRD